MKHNEVQCFPPKPSRGAFLKEPDSAKAASRSGFFSATALCLLSVRWTPPQPSPPLNDVALTPPPGVPVVLPICVLLSPPRPKGTAMRGGWSARPHQVDLSCCHVATGGACRLGGRGGWEFSRALKKRRTSRSSATRNQPCFRRKVDEQGGDASGTELEGPRRNPGKALQGTETWRAGDAAPESFVASLPAWPFDRLVVADDFFAT